MEVLIAPDKFKGCLSALEAARLMAAGARRALPRARLRLMPLADGGDGTGDVLARALGGRKISARVQDPLGRPVRASWIWFPKNRIALVELAQASGLWRLSPKERNPLKTSTYGTGELIKAALGRSPKGLWVAVGGSATVDGGVGLIQALGARLGLDRPARGEDLGRLRLLDLSGLARLPPVTVLCDVTNPLTGPRGAARVFGPQKGASPADVRKLEEGLKNWERLLTKSGRRAPGRSRTGAAGGAAAALAAVFGARLVPGAGAVMEAAGFEDALRRADAVMTGEGWVDRTTGEGKAVGEVLRRAARMGKPALVAAGGRGEGAAKALRSARGAAFLGDGISVEESMRRARELLPKAAGRLLKAAIR